MSEQTNEEKRIDELYSLVEKLVCAVGELKQRVDAIDGSCKNMDRHINFVEKSYDNLCNSKPLFLASKISSFFGGNKAIEN